MVDKIKQIIVLLTIALIILININATIENKTVSENNKQQAKVNTTEKLNNPQTHNQVKNTDIFGTLTIPSKNIQSDIYNGEQNLNKQNLIIDTKFNEPGSGKNIVLAGHREKISKVIKQIEVNDIIQITTDEKRYNYQVNNIQIVDQENTKLLEDTGEEQLVIYTCYPFDRWSKTNQRYVIVAKVIEQ